jgi:hypothetical protein
MILMDQALFIKIHGFVCPLISSDGANDRRNSPDNCPEAKVSFSKCFIKLIIIYLLIKHSFDKFLAREKSLHVGMLRVVPGKKP